MRVIGESKEICAGHLDRLCYMEQVHRSHYTYLREAEHRLLHIDILLAFKNINYKSTRYESFENSYSTLILP